MHWKDLENGHNSLLKRSLNWEILVNHFNNATPEKSNDPEIICSSKARQNITLKHESLSLFYINTCSLAKNFDDHQNLLSCTEIFLTY